MRNKNAKVSDANIFVSDAGSPVHTLYSSKVMPDGKIKLTESGYENIQEKINSFKYTTDMQFILSKLAQGDTSVLNQREPMFGDQTQMPKTYAESLQLVIDGKKKFYELPVDIRSKFNNDFSQWFATAGSDLWFKKMGVERIASDQVKDVVPDPVKEKEVTE